MHQHFIFGVFSQCFCAVGGLSAGCYILFFKSMIIANYDLFTLKIRCRNIILLSIELFGSSVRILQKGGVLFVCHHCKVSLFWPSYIDHWCFLSFLCKLTVNFFRVVIGWVSVAFDLHFHRKKHYALNKPYPESPPLLLLWNLRWLTTGCYYKTPHLEHHHL